MAESRPILARAFERDREGQLVENDFYDALTVLPNRKLFLDRVGRSLEHAKRHTDHLFAVLFADIDRFKVVNECMGHEFGEQLLAEIGHRLQRCLRTADTVGRFGGDKYVVLLDGLSHITDAIRIVERIRKVLFPPVGLNGHEIFTSACIGVALSSGGYSEAEELVRDAEIAMYRAKREGTGRYAIFDPTMHEQAVRLMRVESDLRRAVGHEELLLHYQPIVSLETGKIKGFEALLRWQHPDRGLLMPAEFIPVAEETDLIIPISQWVLREACRQSAKWGVQFPGSSIPNVSVNLTGKYLGKKDLVGEIGDLISENRLDPGHLTVEITEDQIMENAERVSNVLTELSNSGIRISIDDFGTGYSSLSYLASFPVHALKIDRSFVSRLNGTAKNLSIVRSIVSLGQNLGLDVIAEGVETEAQLEYLRAMKCEYAQGYYFSRPCGAEITARFIALMAK